eukprot:COSAG05_NODE_176_length_14928_cov_75.109717_16_plen_485_part_00
MASSWLDQASSWQGDLRFEDPGSTRRHAEALPRDATADEVLEQAFATLFADVLSKGATLNAFRKMDRNHDGTLEVSELRRGLLQLGMDVPHNHGGLDLILSSLDTDGDGRISYTEFVDRVWIAKLKTVRSKFRAASYVRGGQDWRQLFHEFDQDNSGALSIHEFVKVIRRHAKLSLTQVSDEELTEIFEHIDTHNSGSIDLAEFAEFLAVDDKRDERAKQMTALAQQRLATAPPRKRLQHLAARNSSLKSQLGAVSRAMMQTLEATAAIDASKGRRPDGLTGKLPSGSVRKLRQVNAQINALHAENKALHAKSDGVTLGKHISGLERQLASMESSISRLATERRDTNAAIRVIETNLAKKGVGGKNEVGRFERDFKQAAHEAEVTAQLRRDAERKITRARELSARQDEKIAAFTTELRERSRHESRSLKNAQEARRLAASVAALRQEREKTDRSLVIVRHSERTKKAMDLQGAPPPPPPPNPRP